MADFKTLVRLLNIMDFPNKSGFEIGKMNFKTANPVLFRRIVCFLLNELGDFNEIVKTFDSPKSSIKLEISFRNSIKDIVTSINGYYPNEYKIKPIGQSHLIAPQGVKVIEFLLTLCQTIILIKFKQAGEPFVEPKNADEYELFMSARDNIKGFVDPKKQLEKVEEEFHLLKQKEDLVNVERKAVLNKLISCPFVPHDIKTKAKSKFNYDLLIEWKELTALNLLKKKEDMCKLQSLYDSKLKIALSYDSLKNRIRNITPLDGFKILNDLGFKSTMSAKMNDVELIDDSQLNFISLLKACSLNVKWFGNFIETSGAKTLCEIQDLARKEDASLKQTIDDINEIELYVDVVDNQFKEITDRMQKEAKEKLNSSSDEFLIKARKFYQKVDSFSAGKYSEESLSSNESQFPVADVDLIKWVLGDKKSNVSLHLSIKKEIPNSPKFLSLSSKKLNVKPFERSEKMKSMSSRTALLLGLCSDRRATLASPSPRRERIKFKHRDNQRVPLKAPPKSLFFSSSPLNSLSAQKPSFAEVSEVDKDESFARPSCSFVSEKDDSIKSLALTGGLPLNRSLSDPCLNISQEIAKWDCTSDSELDLSGQCTDFSPPKPKFYSLIESPTTPQ